MRRSVVSWISAAAAGLALCAGAARAEEPRPPLSTRSTLSLKPVAGAPSFFSSVLAPRLDARLGAESIAAADFVNRSANPWTRDPDAVSRVERSAIRATKGALKRYVIDRLQLDGWSVPLVGGGGHGLAALRTEAGGTRLRFGFARMAPRAEVLVPSAQGRFAVSIDARGRLGASFETKSSSLRIGGAVDPSSHEATLGLIRRF